MIMTRTRGVETGVSSEALPGQGQPGERAEVFVRAGGFTSAVLAGDAAGGLKDGVLAGMALSMFRSALSHGCDMEYAVSLVLELLPADGAPGPTPLLALEVGADGMGYLACTGLPLPVFLRRGRVRPLPGQNRALGARTLWESRFLLAARDTLVCVGGGVARAGEAQPAAADWHAHLLPAYLEAAYTPSIPAQKLADLVVNASRSLCGNRPAFDLNACVFRFWGRCV